MKRLIDADALIEGVKQLVDFLYSFEVDELVECGRIIHNGIIQEVKMMPTIDAEPVRHGQWNIFHNDNIPFAFKCSACGQLTIVATKCCPNCGARMEEDEE